MPVDQWLTGAATRRTRGPRRLRVIVAGQGFPAMTLPLPADQILPQLLGEPVFSIAAPLLTGLGLYRCLAVAGHGSSDR